MVKAWKYAGPNSDSMIESAIRQGFAYAVFVDEEPVTWSVMQ